MDSVEIITLTLSIVSMVVSIFTHVRHSKCSNCCEVDFQSETK